LFKKEPVLRLSIDRFQAVFVHCSDPFKVAEPAGGLWLCAFDQHPRRIRVEPLDVYTHETLVVEFADKSVHWLRLRKRAELEHRSALLISEPEAAHVAAAGIALAQPFALFVP
jgi:hypothetical protein